MDWTRFGYCTTAPSTIWQPCTPSSDTCEGGTFCETIGTGCAAADDVAATFGYPIEVEGVCLLPVREGGECDSNLVDRDRYFSGGGVELGCMPCEAGTWCLPDSLTGVAGTGSHCVRACEVDGAGSDDLCACTSPSCDAVSATPVVNPATGATIGRFFCEPCVVSVVQTCDGTVDCCNDEASCHTVLVDVPRETERALCCVDPGGSCNGEFAHDPCCPGSVCDGEECQFCGREGDDPEELACCPGYIATGEPGTVRSCQRCSVAGLSCSDEFFEFISLEETSVEAVAVPETDVPWFRVEGSSGGDVSPWAAYGDVHYLLTPEHRAFLFEGYLDPFEGGISAGTSVFLPMNASPGVEQRIPAVTPRGELGSTVIYDVGACSYLVSWPLMATLFPIYINRALTDLPNASRLTPTDFEVTPRIAAEPVSVSLPRGPLSMSNEIDVHAVFTTPSIGGCANQQLTVDATLALREVPARIQNPDEEAIDAEVVARVGCVQRMDPPPYDVYDCTLVDEIDYDADTVTFEVVEVGIGTVSTPWDDSDALRELLGMVGCTVGPSSYECFYPPPSHSSALPRRVSYPSRVLRNEPRAVRTDTA